MRQYRFIAADVFAQLQRFDWCKCALFMRLLVYVRPNEHNLAKPKNKVKSIPNPIQLNLIWFDGDSVNRSEQVTFTVISHEACNMQGKNSESSRSLARANTKIQSAQVRVQALIAHLNWKCRWVKQSYDRNWSSRMVWTQNAIAYR